MGNQLETKNFNMVYQFKITLKNISPPIWRRISVPSSYTFWDLHVAIQDAFGWDGYHLHNFTKKDPQTGKLNIIEVPSEDSIGNSMRMVSFDETKEKISDWFSKAGTALNYTYDFGDDWEHEVKLEEVLPREKNKRYPSCIGGKRACPPEDCGGPWGYKEFLVAIKNKKHERHIEMTEWIGGDFDPEYFDISEVSFEDPKEAWETYNDFIE